MECSTCYWFDEELEYCIYWEVSIHPKCKICIKYDVMFENK